jgi:hypothetical protein
MNRDSSRGMRPQTLTLAATTHWEIKLHAYVKFTTLLKPLPTQYQGCSPTSADTRTTVWCTHLSILDLIKRGHNVQSHQFRSLGNDGISAHCSNCRDLSVLSLVGGKLSSVLHLWRYMSKDLP